ncbi:unnamed protein product [Mytilus edulis]|uniref:Transposable element P transposase-like RNase H domain-containing protein n=1 Tax=Mytilus edulis TaxID=6550 RepID=A0A8S3RG97_MYTED|nr:unnamed protein product [Mytilus edulis]
MAFIPVGTSVENAEGSASSQCFRAGDFEAVKCTISYSSTVRRMNCLLPVQGNRCSPCTQLRRVLKSRKHGREEKERKTKENIPNYLHSTIGHTKMSRHELITKIHQQKDKITTLQSEIDKTQRKFQREVSSRGVTLDFCQTLEIDHGFLPDVVKELKNEASKREMYSKVDLWKNYVGLLFDEIKVKSDLVYDKHSGELIGYCNLDKVGNQIMNFERIMKDTSITETDADIAK